MSTRSLPPPPPVFTLRCGQGEVTALCVVCGWSPRRNQQPDDEELVSGHSTGDTHIWDLKTYRARLTWSSHPNHRVQWIGGSQNGKLLTYGRDGFVNVWRRNAGETTTTTPEKIASIKVDCYTHCLCTSTSNYLVTPYDDGKFYVWDHRQDYDKPLGMVVPCFAPEKCGTATCIKLVDLPEKTVVFAGFESGLVASWDVTKTDGSCLSRLQVHAELVTCLDFDVDVRRGVSGSAEDELVTWEATAEDMLIKRTTTKMTNPGAACVRIHPSGIYAAVGCWDHRLRIYSWVKMKPLAVLDFHQGTIQSLSFVFTTTQDTMLLAAGSRDGLISLWNLYEKRTKNSN